MSRGHRYADKAKELMFNPIGQIVGTLNSVRTVKEVMMELVDGYLEATERLQSLAPSDAA